MVNARSGPMDAHLDSMPYAHLSTVFEQQQQPSSFAQPSQMVDSSVWASPPPQVPASPGPGYDFVPAPSFAYAVATSPDHNMMADASAANNGVTDTSGATMAMSPMSASSYQAMPYTSMMLPFEPPSPTVNLQVPRSADPDGSDLPSDASTLRFFYNIGWDHFRMYATQSFMYSPMHGYNGNFSFTLFPYIADPNAMLPDIQCSMPEGPATSTADTAPNDGTPAASNAFAAAEVAVQNGHPNPPLPGTQQRQTSGCASAPASVNAAQSQN
ncbi:uncharacterized protein LOC120847437 [Ixodes scapularis]|uniref:uncharacterized protein LOC120847437 n=1 Tax=Ixodes scapularis TaxID=6945 RepID=UPI001A9FDC7C|nr:uncharacterized protein LOC120847437 [Ixodes scapularis]